VSDPKLGPDRAGQVWQHDGAAFLVIGMKSKYLFPTAHTAHNAVTTHVVLWLDDPVNPDLSGTIDTFYELIPWESHSTFRQLM
jgi:hypothetical protein